MAGIQTHVTSIQPRRQKKTQRTTETRVKNGTRTYCSIHSTHCKARHDDHDDDACLENDRITHLKRNVHALRDAPRAPVLTGRKPATTVRFSKLHSMQQPERLQCLPSYLHIIATCEGQEGICFWVNYSAKRTACSPNRESKFTNCPKAQNEIIAYIHPGGEARLRISTLLEYSWNILGGCATAVVCTCGPAHGE